MEKETKLTLIGLIVTIVVISFITLIMLPALSIPPTHRFVCSTNLKGLGTAISVYANDYDDKYPKLGLGPWSKELGYSHDDTDFKPYEYEGPCTITSSLYLLVREADVSPASFVCPQQSEQVGFDGQNTKGLDIVELWDFGSDPYKHVSYAYHNPYGKYPPDGSRSASFAVMSDMNPWIKDGDFVSPNADKTLPPQIIDISDTATLKNGNSLNHTETEEDFLIFFKRIKKSSHGFGQPVQYADGHVSYEERPNVGVNNDNIYTFWSAEENPTEQDIQGGMAPTGRSPENDAKSETDSFLAI